MAAPVGFIGLGIMGKGMAANLAKIPRPLVVWNRTRQVMADAAGSRHMLSLMPTCSCCIGSLALAQSIPPLTGSGPLWCEFGITQCLLRFVSAALPPQIAEDFAVATPGVTVADSPRQVVEMCGTTFRCGSSHPARAAHPEWHCQAD